MRPTVAGASLGPMAGSMAPAVRLGDDGRCSHRQAGEHKGPGSLFHEHRAKR